MKKLGAGALKKRAAGGGEKKKSGRRFSSPLILYPQNSRHALTHENEHTLAYGNSRFLHFNSLVCGLDSGQMLLGLRSSWNSTSPPFTTLLP
jgi:hypothetical protein